MAGNGSLPRAGRVSRWSGPGRPLTVGLVVAVTVALVTACLPNYADPPAVATGVIGSAPANGGRGVPTSAPIVLRFSAPVAAASISVATTPAVALGAPQWIGDTGVSFSPPSALPANTAITVNVSGNDKAGKPIAVVPIAFTTAPSSAGLGAAHPRLLLTGTTRTRLATALSGGQTSATRFKGFIDDFVFNGSTYISEYDPWWGAMLGVLTNDARYCADSVQRIDLQVSTAESEIAANRNPEIAGDSYLYAGDMLGSLALVWDWCPTNRTPAMTTRWSAYAQQTLFNIWNPASAKWGTRSAPWSGWGTDNPRNNYFLSFLQATLLWGAAANGEHAAAAGWLSFARQKVERDLTIIHTTETAGGGSLEGTGYGTSIKRLLFLEFVWEASTGQRWADLSSSNEGWIDYLSTAVVPTGDWFAPIGDQARISDAPFTDYQREILLALAELHRGTAIGRLSRARAGTFLTQMDRPEESVFDFLYGVADPGTAAPLPLTYAAPGTGHVFARSSTATNATWLGFLAGPYVESHAHHDALSLLLYKSGWKIDDGVRQSHSGLTQSEEAHALVMLQNGATPVRMVEGNSADLYALRSAPDYVHIAGSAGMLYPGHTIDQTREVVFLPPDVVVVLDRVDSGSENLTRTFQLPTPTAATIAPDTKTITTGAGAGALKVQRIYPDTATVATQPFTTLVGTIPGFESDFTGGFRTTEKVTATGKSEFLHVLSFGTAVASATKVADGSVRGVTITFADGRTASVSFDPASRRGALEIKAADGTVTRQIDLMPGVERP